MPFSHVAHAYQPEQLEKLTAAFNQAWPSILYARGGIPAHSEWLRKMLADYILACASAGSFDPDELTEKALRAFIKQDGATTPEREAQTTFSDRPMA